MNPMGVATDASLQAVAQAVAHLADPEIPVISLSELGILREIRTGTCTSLMNAARSSKLPSRCVPSVNTFFTPAAKASLLIHGKLRRAQTTTAGSALPMKYSSSAA